jgi:hypothetical protein
MEAAEERQVQAARQRVSDDAVRIQREREGLELSRTRIVRELGEARHPRHREQLTAALTFLEERLVKLTA